MNSLYNPFPTSNVILFYKYDCLGLSLSGFSSSFPTITVFIYIFLHVLCTSIFSLLFSLILTFSFLFSNILFDLTFLRSKKLLINFANTTFRKRLFFSVSFYYRPQFNSIQCHTLCKQWRFETSEFRSAEHDHMINNQFFNNLYTAEPNKNISVFVIPINIYNYSSKRHFSPAFAYKCFYLYFSNVYINRICS